MNILVIDSSEKERAHLGTVLESAGYHRTTIARTPSEAVRLLKTTDWEKVLARMDLILIEVSALDQAPKVIQTDRTGTGAVLLGLVDQSDAGNLAMAFESGVRDVITRPYDESVLKMRIAAAVAFKKERAARLKAESRLTLKARQLDRASYEKTEILSLACHELKTPLANLSGYVDRLLLDWERNGAPSEKQHSHLETVQRNSFRMEALVDDIMVMAKIESGTLDLSLSELDVAYEIEEIIGCMQGQMEEKNLNLNVLVPPDLPKVHADQGRFSQIFVNLLSNACKYSPGGAEISINVEHRDRLAQISVADTGIGISKKDQKKLFSQFFRANNPQSRAISGTGLGLYVTKRLVEAHGGKIGVHSVVGEGSTFCVTLPLSHPSLSWNGSARTGPRAKRAA